MPSLQEIYTKLSEKEKKMFYFAVAFVVVALFDLLFLQPVLSRMKHMDDEIEEKRNMVVQNIRYLSYADKILKEREEFGKYEAGKAKEEEDKIIANFLSTVQSIAAGTKVNWTKLNPGGKDQKKGYVEYYADLECEGKLEDMIKFMYQVDTTENLLRIVKVNMTAAKASPDNVKATMKVGKLIIDMNTISNYNLSDEGVDVENETELVKDISKYGSGGGGGAGTETGQEEGKGGGETGTQAQTGSGTGGGGAGPGTGEGGDPTTKGGGTDSGTGGSSDGGVGSGGGGAGAGDGAGIQEKGSPDKPDEHKEERKANKLLGLDEKKEETARPKVDSVFDLWNKFWGIEPTPEKVDPKKVTADGYPEDYKIKKNLWERMLTPAEQKAKDEKDAKDARDAKAREGK